MSSAELYTQASYTYGRYEARIQFAAGDGVVSSFFLWKDGSELADVFWNELDFEKLEADCRLETNALYGLPEASHNQRHVADDDFCGDFHTYAYEWTPDYIAWFVDGQEIRRETGAAAAAFRDNAAGGMQLRFNVWPGDATFGGTFDPAILPVHQYINWVQYYAYVDGAFELRWREDFTGNTVPSGWQTGSWGSPKNLSTHTPANVNFIGGYAVLSLTADDATGAADAMPSDSEGMAPAEMGTPGAGGGTGSPDPTSPGDSSGDPAPVPTGTGGDPSSPSAGGATPLPPTPTASAQPPTTPAPPGPDTPTPLGPDPSALPGATSTTSPPPTRPGGSSGPDVSVDDAENDGGCDCHVAGRPLRAGLGWMALSLGLTLFYRRRGNR